MPEEMGETQDPQSADFVALNYLAPGVSSKVRACFIGSEDDDMMQVANQLKLLEVERNQMHVAATKEVVDYNAKFLSKEH
eukprot:g16628.t1